jgi:hypothetical protein
MKAPDDSPETEVCCGSAPKAGSFSAAAQALSTLKVVKATSANPDSKRDSFIISSSDDGRKAKNSNRAIHESILHAISLQTVTGRLDVLAA